MICRRRLAHTRVARRYRLRQTLDHRPSPFLSDDLPGFVTVHWLKTGYGRIIQTTRGAGRRTRGREDIANGSSIFSIESDIEDLICPRLILG